MTNTKSNSGIPFGKTIETFIKEIITDFPSNVSKTVREDVLSHPPVNVVEKTEGFDVEISVPGYEKQDFIIKLVDKTLSVSSNKIDEPLAPHFKSLKKEFTRKAFQRNFTLTESVIKENISARYENGLLKIYLPKVVPTTYNPQDINIQ